MKIQIFNSLSKIIIKKIINLLFQLISLNWNLNKEERAWEI